MSIEIIRKHQRGAAEFDDQDAPGDATVREVTDAAGGHEPVPRPAAASDPASSAGRTNAWSKAGPAEWFTSQRLADQEVLPPDVTADQATDLLLSGFAALAPGYGILEHKIFYY